MKISYQLLQQFLNFPIAYKDLSHILTSIGLEVECFDVYRDIKSNLEHCCVGQVVACEKHPAADKLKLTQVDVGHGQTLSIVCGAPNVAVGQKVMVAKIGAKLTNFNNEELHIQKAKIRGCESFGMLCSDYEIGLAASHDGISVLDATSYPGQPLSDYFKIYDDVVYEIGLTPNRMDTMSHFGVARDVAAYLNYHQKASLQIQLPIVNINPAHTSKTIQVKVQNQDQCLRYCGILLTNVNIKPSPKWLQNYLSALGVKSINNIVDITNYILHTYGQPLHAFDADKIEGRVVNVMNVQEGTRFLTLDKNDIKLTKDDLAICDALQKPMCIAGVFGGFDSGIKPTTQNIFLEAAVFNPISVRKTSFFHQLRTDAAQRFEKGVDVSSTLNVLKIATQLILDLGGGTIEGDFIDTLSSPMFKKELQTSLHFIQQLSGKKYTLQDIKTILEGLQFEVNLLNNDNLLLKIPFHKLDIQTEHDIVEEVMRIDGIDNIPIPSVLKMTLSEAKTSPFELKNQIRNFLIGKGLNEIFTNSISNPAFLEPTSNYEPVRIINSVNKNLTILSPYTLLNGLEVMAYNINRKQLDLSFFEFNKKYLKQKENYLERQILSIWLSGNKQIKTWNTEKKEYSLFDLKEIITLLLEKLGLIDKIVYENLEDEYIENGFCIKVGKEKIIHFGYAKGHILHKFDIEGLVIFAEIDWTSLQNILNNMALVPYKDISKFPIMKRDVSFVLDKGVMFSEIEHLILNTQIKYLHKYVVFDIFENEKLGMNKKAVGINFEFLDYEKTLTDNDIDAQINKVQQLICQNLKAEVRTL